MILGTHNSFTYLKPRIWAFRMFKFCYQCQNRTIHQQYNDGVRYFDFRLSFDKNENFQIRHKLVSFKLSFYDFLDIIKMLNNKKDVVIRMVLERNKNKNDEQRFISICKVLEEDYPNITFCCGEDVHTKKVVYQFKAGNGPQVIEQYGSVRGGILGGLWPKNWAKKHNKEIYESYKGTDKYLMIDFYETVTTIH